MILELRRRLAIIILNRKMNKYVTIDSNLSFENHISSICKKASQKLSAFAGIAPYMNIQQRGTIMNTFVVTSQFGYCPLIWMFYSGRPNNKINSIHERALRITYQYHTSTFQELLNKDNTFCFNTSIRQVHSLQYCTKSLSFLGPKVWDLVQVILKQSESLDSFKIKIKN